MSVRRNNRKKWTVDVVYHHPDGRVERICKTSPVQTRRGAEAYERELRQSLLDGSRAREEATKDIPTVEEFSKEFLSTYVAANNKPSERMAKEYIFRLYLVPILGSKRLDEITVRDVERFKVDRLDQKLSPKTINNMLTVLGRMLRYAKEVEVIQVVPSIKFLKLPPRQMHFLDFSEADRLVRAAADEPEALAAILCSVDGGLRVGEIRALQWDDIDFVAGHLHVRRTDYRGYLGSPKGGRARVLPMTAALSSSLKAVRHLKGPWVFSDEAGERWSRGEADVRLWRACRRAKLPKCGWHSLKHTFCSHLAMLGAPARAIQELAGHASLTTTQGYMHLSPAAREGAIRLLEARANIAQTDGMASATRCN